MSTLLPPTPDSMQRILVQGGIPQMAAMRASPSFDRLLEETRSLLQSPDFSIVLESCLDRATDTLFKSIKDTIFVQGGSSVDENGAPLQLRLAGLLPGMARWSHLAFNGLPNELVDVRQPQRFFSVCHPHLIHSSTWQTFMRSKRSLPSSIPSLKPISCDERPHHNFWFLSSVPHSPTLPSVARSVLLVSLSLVQHIRNDQKSVNI